MISYHRVENDKELYEILELQRRNLPINLIATEQKEEGFVTVHHCFDILKKMNLVCPHCIAKVDDKVIGYALCMHPQFKHDISILRPMFLEIELALKNKESEFQDYIAMGQICIDKAFRKKGIFRGLYNFMKEKLNADFAYVITEVDAKNSRSSNAHKAVGFELLKTYIADAKTWELIVMKL